MPRRFRPLLLVSTLALGAVLLAGPAGAKDAPRPNTEAQTLSPLAWLESLWGDLIALAGQPAPSDDEEAPDAGAFIDPNG